MIQINLLPKEYHKSGSVISFGKSGIYVIAGIVAFAAALSGITWYQMNSLTKLDAGIERASQRAAMLASDIKLVDALTDVKEKITQRMNAVEELDRYRTTWVRILEDVSGNMPEFVWMETFSPKLTASAKDAKKKAAEKSDAEAADAKESGKAKGSKEVAKNEKSTSTTTGAQPKVIPVEIEGYSFTLNSLAAFMIKLMRSEHFENVELLSSTEASMSEKKERAYKFKVSADMHFLSDLQLKELAQKDTEPQADDDGATN